MHPLFIFIALAAASPCQLGCSTNHVTNKVTNVTITSDGRDRSYLIWVPPAYKPGTESSVILSYHGGSKTAEDQLQLDKLTDPFFKTPSIVVYPQGINNFWQGNPGVSVNDVLFTSDLIDHLTQNYCIDKNRIFATGKSDGAGFCNTLACDAGTSKRIAAFAPVSGAFYVDTLPCDPDTVKIPCAPARKVPFLEFHGGNDTTVNYTGGERKSECLPSIPYFITEWAVRDGLGTKNTTEQVATDTVRYKFGGGLVQHIFDKVIGHDWPSTLPNADNSKPGHAVASFNATPIVLDFFEKYPLA